MTSIHDALDKAIQSAELSANDSNSKNLYQEQVINNNDNFCKVNAELMTQQRIVTAQNEIESESFRMLRTKILKLLRDNDWDSFAITSPSSGAGKTTVAVNLAIAMASDQNQSILLVDLDLKTPKVNRCFGIDSEYGLSDYFQSNVPLSKILLNLNIERLTLLPGKGRISGSSELLASPKMKSLLNEIKSRNQRRIVIFDLPPVLATDDVLVSMDYYDAILLVVEEGKTKPEELKKTLKLLSNKKLLGTILNKSQSVADNTV